MNQLPDLSTIMDRLSVVSDFYQAHMLAFLSAGLIFALLNCFFGYALRKVWCCIFGLLLGACAGLGVCAYLQLPTQIALLAAAGLGLLCALLAFFLYRIGIFFLCIGIVTFLLFWIFPNPTLNTMVGFLVLGVVIGFLAVIKEHIIVVCMTAICGGIGTAQLFNMMLATPLSSLFFWLIAIGLSVLGLLFQFKPWRGGEYWEYESDKNDRARNRARKRRKQRTGKRKSRPSLFSRKKKARKSRNSSNKQQNSYSQPSNRHSNSSSQYQQATGRPKTSQSPYQQPARPQNNQPQYQQPARPQSSQPQYQQPASGTPNSPYTDSNLAGQRLDSRNPNTVSGQSAGELDNYTVDLSDIRSELSREVQDIYKEKE